MRATVERRLDEFLPCVVRKGVRSVQGSCSQETALRLQRASAIESFRVLQFAELRTGSTLLDWLAGPRGMGSVVAVALGSALLLNRVERSFALQAKKDENTVD